MIDLVQCNVEIIFPIYFGNPKQAFSGLVCRQFVDETHRSVDDKDADSCKGNCTRNDITGHKDPLPVSESKVEAGICEMPNSIERLGNNQALFSIFFIHSFSDEHQSDCVDPLTPPAADKHAHCS